MLVQVSRKDQSALKESLRKKKKAGEKPEDDEDSSAKSNEKGHRCLACYIQVPS